MKALRRKLVDFWVKGWMYLRRRMTTLDRIAFAFGGQLVFWGRAMMDGETNFVSGCSEYTPCDLLEVIYERNQLVVRRGPSKIRVPVGLVITCMDPRIDTSAILGDSRGYFDRVQIPGAVLSAEVMETVRLAVTAHGVKFVMVLSHTDCAMEKIVCSEDADSYPELRSNVLKRDQSFATLCSQKYVTERVRRDELVVVKALLHTNTWEIEELARFAGPECKIT